MPVHAQDKMTERGPSMPCHGNKDGENADGNDALMFMHDCMGIDLMQAQTDSNPDLPDHDSDRITAAIGQDIIVPPNLVTNTIIRGPPGLDERKATTPSVILNTQRFRI